MVSPDLQPVARLQADFGVDRLHLTGHGHQLLEEEPDQIAAFFDTARHVIDNPGNPGQRFEWIGRGAFGHVYGLPGYPNSCLNIYKKQKHQR